MCYADEGDALEKFLSFLRRHRTAIYIAETKDSLLGLDCVVVTEEGPYNLRCPFSNSFFISHDLVVMDGGFLMFYCLSP